MSKVSPKSAEIENIRVTIASNGAIVNIIKTLMSVILLISNYAQRLRHGRHGPRRPRERGGYDFSHSNFFLILHAPLLRGVQLNHTTHEETNPNPF